jgi:hypothetical protein
MEFVVKRRTIFLFGFIFMVLFLYGSMLLFASIHEPNFGEEAFSARGPWYWREVGSFLEQAFIISALPAWVVTIPLEPYYTQLVYYPLLGGLIWFGYGCAVGWGFLRLKIAWVAMFILAIWILFFCLAKVATIPTLT